MADVKTWTTSPRIEPYFVPRYERQRKYPEKSIESEIREQSLILPQPRDERPQETEKKDVMSYVSAVLQYCPYPFPLQRPQKEEFSIVEDMLRCLLSKYSDLNLFSERHRKEVKEMVSILEIVDGEPCFGYAECDETLRQMGKVVRDLAYSKRRLREYEKDSGNSWRTSICYHLDPRYIREMPFLEPQQTALGELDLLLYSGKRCA